ncbi:MAG: hypothetical protein ACLQHF_16815 [Terracidiphilus sp.]
MQPDESEISVIASLRKQIRLLAIVLFGACVLLLVLLMREFMSAPSSNGWPDLSANKLQVKQLVLMTGDGKPAGMLNAVDGSSGLVLLDKKGEIRVIITTAENSGLISLSQEGSPGSTYMRDGAIVMGDDKLGSVLIESPPAREPMIKVSDSSGYAATLGRSVVLNKIDGSQTLTSAASLVGSNNDRATTFSLITQPVSTSALSSDSHGVPKRAPSGTPPNGRK